MIGFLFAVFSQGWVQIAVAVFGVFSLILFLNTRLKKARKKNAEQKNYIETRKRMDEVGRMSDADAARDWLRERGKRRGDL